MIKGRERERKRKKTTTDSCLYYIPQDLLNDVTCTKSERKQIVQFKKKKKKWREAHGQDVHCHLLRVLGKIFSMCFLWRVLHKVMYPEQNYFASDPTILSGKKTWVSEKQDGDSVWSSLLQKLVLCEIKILYFSCDWFLYIPSYFVQVRFSTSSCSPASTILRMEQQQQTYNPLPPPLVHWWCMHIFKINLVIHAYIIYLFQLT